MNEPLAETTPTIDIRTCGINPNHWYVIARSVEVTDQPMGVIIWYRSIVLYRDDQGEVHALENRCPHRHVKLSQGKIVGNNLECAYHGWQFNGTGNCVLIPYLTEQQKLPNCLIKTYPIKELDGFIWLFLGEVNQVQPNLGNPLQIPEWNHLNYIATVSTMECPGHFSFLIENLMDMYHGHLHQNYQAWTSAKLVSLSSNHERVDARYEAQNYYKIDKIWSISQLFFPGLRQLHSDPLEVSYLYPHWRGTLGKDFKIYCLFCPVNKTYTRAYLIHFTSLNAFKRLHKLPIRLRRWLKNRLFGSAQTLLDGLVKQDIMMIEQEQQAYLQNVKQTTYEINPTIGQVQKLIKKQIQLYQTHQ